MSNARRAHLAPVLVLTAFALSACSSMGETLSESLGGLPKDAPQRPATTLPAPNVYEVRPTRSARPLTDEEQKKLESDLTALREGQKQRAAAPDAPPPAPPPPPKTAAAPPAKKPAAKAPTAAKKPAEPLKLAN
jgi:hypothetical protein